MELNIGSVMMGLLLTVCDIFGVFGQRSSRFEDGSLRLVGGRSKNEGTILIYHWSRWGAICDDYWDLRDANVVCNELGFPGASDAPRKSKFGKGRRRVWLSGLHCRGNERHVTMCRSRGWGNTIRRCRSYWSSAGVVCNPKTTTTSTTTSTTTTPKTTTSVTTKRRRTTTTIPITTRTPLNIILNDANADGITLKQTTKARRRHHRRSTTTKNLNTATTTVTTTETPTTTSTTERTATTTEKQTIKTTKVPPKTTTIPQTTTLLTTTNKPTTTTTPPRVYNRWIYKPEMWRYYRYNRDGSFITSRPDPRAFNQTLRQRTTTHERRSTTTLPPSTERRSTRRPTQPPTTASLTETKNPTTTPSREYDTWVFNRENGRYYFYLRDGTFITSKPDRRYFLQMRNTTTTSTTTTTTTTTPRPRRNQNRIGGNNDNDRDEMSSAMSNNVGRNAPQAIRQRPSSRENTQPRHEHRHGHNLRKPGYVGDQPRVDTVDTDSDGRGTIDALTVEDDISSESEDPAPTAPSYEEYRLKGGRKYSGYNEGRVEVRLAGSFEWGVICGDNWNFRAAMVVCRHINIGYARVAQTTDFYGGSDMDKVVATMRCTGREDRLEDCQKEMTEQTPGKVSCSQPSSVAGVICDTRLPDLEADIEELRKSVLLQERYLYYLQCSYEEKCLSSSADALYNTSAWQYATRTLLRFSTVARNIGNADFRPNVQASAWEWHACHQHFHSMEAFSHYDIIDEHGNRVAEGHKASFCLEDSACDRGVYPKYNCLQYGNQGISVGCKDSYLANIDCQWIDVTDVKPGKYTLKVEINPGMLVPEISYDNNAARCDLQFNSQYARLTNCALVTIL